jgi:hypothetical protein
MFRAQRMVGSNLDYTALSFIRNMVVKTVRTTGAFDQ